MEFNFDVSPFLPERITKIKFNCRFHFHQQRRNDRVENPSLAVIIDRMGVMSSKAQGLNNVITTFDKVQSSSDQWLYIMRDENTSRRVMGFMKVGYKNLFIIDLESRQNEMKTLCVLDFYVHESLQRKGFGKELFDFVLQDLNMDPRKLAIDRPSDKFLAFLMKHYGMRLQIPQVNNFVVFDGFFSKSRSGTSRQSSAKFKRPAQTNHAMMRNQRAIIEDPANVKNYPSQQTLRPSADPFSFGDVKDSTPVDNRPGFMSDPLIGQQKHVIPEHQSSMWSPNWDKNKYDTGMVGGAPFPYSGGPAVVEGVTRGRGRRHYPHLQMHHNVLNSSNAVAAAAVNVQITQNYASHRAQPQNQLQTVFRTRLW